MMIINGRAWGRECMNEDWPELAASTNNSLEGRTTGHTGTYFPSASPHPEIPTAVPVGPWGIHLSVDAFVSPDTMSMRLAGSASPAHLVWISDATRGGFLPD